MIGVWKLDPEKKYQDAAMEEFLGMLGYIPTFIDPSDSTPVAKQINLNYAHGGGWQASDVGFTMGENHELIYPGDPTMWPVAEYTHGNEVVRVYPYAWVTITQLDGSWEINRLD